MLGDALGVGAERIDNLDPAGGGGGDVNLIVADSMPALMSFPRNRAGVPSTTPPVRIIRASASTISRCKVAGSSALAIRSSVASFKICRPSLCIVVSE